MSIPKAPDDLVNPIRKELPRIARELFLRSEKKEPLPGVYAALPDPRKPGNRHEDEPYSNFMLFSFDASKFAYFAIGDLHGDLRSFVRCADAAIETVRQSASPDRTVCLVVLGDLVDRGCESTESIAFLLRLALGMDNARRNVWILFVKGDHDVALRPTDAEVRTGVSNGTGSGGDRLADELADPESWFSPSGALVRAFVRFLDGCPAAAWFDNGMLFAHGAVPHVDLQGRLGVDLSLWSPACAKDFMWCRLHERAPKKIPNRGSSTCEIGYKDFGAFVDWLNEASARCFPGGKPLGLYVHGHEHVSGGYKPFPAYPIPVHTLTSFSDPDAYGTPAVCRILELFQSDKGTIEARLVEPDAMSGMPTPSTENPPPPETKPENPVPEKKEPEPPPPPTPAPKPPSKPRLSTSVVLFCKRLFSRIRSAVDAENEFDEETRK